MTIWRCCLLLLVLGLALTRPVWADLIVNASNGTVTDRTTHLVWDRCPYGASGVNCELGWATRLSWADGMNEAAAANAASYKGFADWRVPSKDELESIAWIDATAFPGTPKSWFWTSTTYEPDPWLAWTVDFSKGAPVAMERDFVMPSLRIVRGGQSLFSPVRLTQTIRFANPGAQTVGATFALTATASSGLAPTFSASTTGVCTTTPGGTLSVVAVGICTIIARQAGSGSHYAAAPVRQSFSVVSAASPTIPPLPVDLPGLRAQPAIVNMAAGEGPAYMADLVTMLSSALGQPLRLIGQDAQGTVTLSGYLGGKLAFVPIDYQGGDPRVNGIYPLGDGRYQVVRNGPSGGQSLVIAPALVSLDQLLALLPGVRVRQADNGVLTATVNGLTYVVQPGVGVQADSATGSARLSRGTDGNWHFIDAQGNHHILYPVFADPAQGVTVKL